MSDYFYAARKRVSERDPINVVGWHGLAPHIHGVPRAARARVEPIRPARMIGPDNGIGLPSKGAGRGICGGSDVAAYYSRMQRYFYEIFIY
jgi:hypothetical protein